MSTSREGVIIECPRNAFFHGRRDVIITSWMVVINISLTVAVLLLKQSIIVLEVELVWKREIIGKFLKWINMAIISSPFDSIQFYSKIKLLNWIAFSKKHFKIKLSASIRCMTMNHRRLHPIVITKNDAAFTTHVVEPK